MDLIWTKNGPNLDKNGPNLDKKWTQNDPKMDLK